MLLVRLPDALKNRMSQHSSVVRALAMVRQGLPALDFKGYILHGATDAEAASPAQHCLQTRLLRAPPMDKGPPLGAGRRRPSGDGALDGVPQKSERKRWALPQNKARCTP